MTGGEESLEEEDRSWWLGAEIGKLLGAPNCRASQAERGRASRQAVGQPGLPPGLWLQLARVTHTASGDQEVIRAPGSPDVVRREVVVVFIAPVEFPSESAD